MFPTVLMPGSDYKPLAELAQYGTSGDQEAMANAELIADMRNALPDVFDLVDAASIMCRHIDVWREEMPGSIIAGDKRLREVLARLREE